MTSYDDLRKKIDELIDPGFNLPFKVVGGIKKLVVGPTGVVELELYLKDKQKNEQPVLGVKQESILRLHKHLHKQRTLCLLKRKN